MERSSVANLSLIKTAVNHETRGFKLHAPVPSADRPARFAGLNPYRKSRPMFYWLLPEQTPKLQQALESLNDLYKGSMFASDMLIALGKNLSFLSDVRFVDSCRAIAENDQEKSLLWRLHVLAWAATCALRVPGDFVECGVLRGFSSAVLCRYLDFARVPKNFYLYDTFSGPSEDGSTQEERTKWSKHAALADPAALVARVKATFAPYPNVRIIQGAVPASFAQAAPQAISYLHIDMNSEKAEIAALEHLYDRVSPGGLIILDDFGWICNRGQMVGELEFMKKRNQPILELPTGQGLILKGPQSA
jgi:O-methyltransferase